MKEVKEDVRRNYFIELILQNKEHKKIGKILNVTVDFIAEVITCIRTKIKKLFQDLQKR